MDKPWIANYPEGVPTEIDTSSVPDVASLMDETFRERADWVGLVHMMSTITFGEIDRQANAFGAYLRHELGLQRGDRVAIMMPNCMQYPIAVLACLRAGLVVVNTNPLYTARELEHQLTDSGAKAMLVIEMFAATLEEVIDRTSVEHVVVTSLGELLGGLKKHLINAMVRHVKKMVPKWSLPGAVRFSKAVQLGAKHPAVREQMSHDDLAFLQYTGGTTGVAKGAMLTHGNIVSNVLMVEAWMLGGGFDEQSRPNECIVTALPLYHIFAATASMSFCRLGVRQLLITNPRDTALFIRALKATPFTGMTGVNTLFNSLLEADGFAELDFSKFHLALGGGMATQRPVAERWKEVTGKPIIEAYGLTETSPGVTINPLNATEFRGAIGLPLPSTEVCVRNEEGEMLPVGEAGELCVRGPQVMAGYWQRPEATEKAIDADGWFRTGDVAKADEDGYFYIVDRLKDMVLVSGFNVYPNEVEEVACSHPKISMAGVIGVPDERSGEAVKLFAIRSDDSVTEQEIRDWCREHLTGYKVPSQVQFVDELPMTPVGKILRRELRDRYHPS